MTTGSTFVTGAYGMVGRWLVAALLERGERVVVLKRQPGGPSAPALDGVEARCRVVVGDVADADLLARVVVEQNVDTIFHLAAQSIRDAARTAPAETFTTNIQGTWAVLEAARLGGVRRVVVAASTKAYGSPDLRPHTEDMILRPTSPYDVSKAAADLIARSYWHTYGLPVATTRCANVYGGGDRNHSRLIPELVAAALDRRAPKIRSDGTPARDFLYVEDAVAAYLAIADALDREDGEARGQAFNAGGGRLIAVREVVDTLGRVAGAPLRATYAEHGAARGDGEREHVDTTMLRRVCGWRPQVELEEGLRRTLDWYRRARAHGGAPTRARASVSSG